MAGAKEQVTRLLALVPYLQAHPDGVGLESAAQRFGVTPKQLVRDLQVVWFCGLPGLGPGDLIDVDMDALGPDGDGVIRLSNADFLRRPLRLQSSEASALVLALRALREGTTAESSRDAIDRALVKLEAATSEAASAEVIDVPTPDPRTADVRRQLEQAVTSGRQVRLGYFVPSRDENTERVVDPLAVLDAEGSAYLDAWCHLAEDRRLFRLDRIDGIDVLDSAVEPHDVEPRDLSEGLFEASQDDVVATVRLARPARWVAEYYPVASTTELEDGALEVGIRAGDPRWLVRLVLRLAPYAEVVGPPDLAAAVTRQARTALGAYGD
ncbi:protein pafC [Marmoricola endophyticus]|uniref:Protein pafC n=1 Tax=Marmoricola endophyticus TaxID=2040280 RepID=A0A917BB48_9ACTN|nr:WYL domain-containing protein [Marmoricola endophyticus]GGF34376.1 protein pafC [Marmoricola endophyticus]